MSDGPLTESLTNWERPGDRNEFWKRNHTGCSTSDNSRITAPENRFHVHPERKMGDIMPAGLLACGSMLISHLPKMPGPEASYFSGVGEELTAYSCGGSHGFKARVSPLPCSLFIPPAQCRTGTGMRFRYDSIDLHCQSAVRGRGEISVPRGIQIIKYLLFQSEDDCTYSSPYYRELS